MPGIVISYFNDSDRRRDLHVMIETRKGHEVFYRYDNAHKNRILSYAKALKQPIIPHVSGFLTDAALAQARDKLASKS